MRYSNVCKTPEDHQLVRLWGPVLAAYERMGTRVPDHVSLCRLALPPRGFSRPHEYGSRQGEVDGCELTQDETGRDILEASAIAHLNDGTPWPHPSIVEQVFPGELPKGNVGPVFYGPSALTISWHDWLLLRKQKQGIGLDSSSPDNQNKGKTR